LQAFNGTEGFLFYFCFVYIFIGLPIDGMLGSPKPPRGGGVNPPIDGSDKDGGGGIDIPTKEGGGGKFENVPKEGGGGKFGKIPNVGGGGKFGSDPPKEGGGGKVSDDPNEGGGGN
jgi:hypothetical protein